MLKWYGRLELSYRLAVSIILLGLIAAAILWAV